MECQTLTTGGTSNTLADVAAYYYATDLREPNVAAGTGTCTGPVIPPNTIAEDLCTNNVPASGRDVATHQHMTTFTLGLGAQGQMVFSPNYWNDTSGDFYDVKVGTTTNTGSGICSWQTSGVCNWPAPVSNTITTIDDLWHAAINGRGSYFSAKDPQSLADGLSSTLQTIANIPTPGTAAAAATSNPNISAADNYVFSSSYKSVEWYGELIRQQIDASGNLTPQQWSAMQLLDCATTSWTATTSFVVGAVYKNGTTCYRVTTDYTSAATFGIADTTNTTVVPGAPVTRTIYTKNASANSLIPFQWGSLSGTQQGYFTTPALSAVNGGLSQFCASGGSCLAGGAQSNNTIATGGAAGEALVNFLRGDRTNEVTFYRKRVHVLGDIVASEARYVQKPLFNYGDAGYGDFKIAKTARNGAVYVAANDGMLHAFDAATGQENWAYIPSMVLPNMYKLADFNYASQHQYFVDNTPETGDICPNAPGSACDATQWKTILVGGLNRGGKGYYALDVTNPASPALLWEFTDANLGYSFGNPAITKLQNGTWVVMFSSGYNNADGLGHLYVLNANTGALIRNISNGTGSATTPSGLGGIAGHANSPLTDNTSIAVYAGDLLGNLWRYDINGNIGAAGYDAQLLASFRDASNNVQSIQAEPTVITKDGVTIVLAGTGRFLGTSDVANVDFQSFYAVKDTMGSTTHGAIRTSANGFVQQTLTSGTCPNDPANPFCLPGQLVRTSSSIAVDWTTNNGWYVDFLTGGERAATNPALQLGTLLFTTITPVSNNANACGLSSGTADSFIYALDYATGGAVQGSGGVSGVSLGSGFATAPIFVKLADGSVTALIRVSDGAGTGTDLGSTRRWDPPIPPRPQGTLRRISWRELPTQ
ncbi:MAG: PQQ-binding-like beta-propeller repeat protein [Betaproteobacteria bacterium]|nr:PQQ-binding-like beta-propeller repeat protein [Betaproteobacteria bacterium]